MPNEQVLFRNSKETGYFQVDNKLLDEGFGNTLGPYALAVYMSICRHANYTTQEAFPSIRTIASETGMGRSTVAREIIVLEQGGLITKKTRTRGRFYSLYAYKSNKYRLTHRDTWDLKQVRAAREKMRLEQHKDLPCPAAG